MTIYVWHGNHCPIISVYADDAAVEQRLRDIEANKPASEQATRKRLLRTVLGTLPDGVLRAGAAYDKAWAAYNKAGAAYDKAWAAYNKAWAAYNKAGAAYNKAWAAFEQARAAFERALELNMPAILALHAVECPDCPWDGQTIFPEEAKS